MRAAAKRSTLNVRIKPEVRGLIDRAAELVGKNRTDFVLDAARQAAEEALLDRTVWTVSPKAYAEFLARLDAPPRPNRRLQKNHADPGSLGVSVSLLPPAFASEPLTEPQIQALRDWADQGAEWPEAAGGAR